jgi:hypothetical protein
VSSILSENEFLLTLNVEDGGKVVLINSGCKIVYRIEYQEKTKQLVLLKVVKNQSGTENDYSVVKIGCLSILKEDAQNRILSFKIDQEEYGKDLEVVFSLDGAEFSVLRDESTIIQFISSRGPAGKSGGIFRVVSGERKGFVLALSSIIYISQVSLPSKDWLFRFSDSGQRPVFRTESISSFRRPTVNPPIPLITGILSESNSVDQKNRLSGKSGILSETNGVDQKNRISAKSGPLSEINGIDQKNRPSGKSGILSETNGVDQKNRIPEKSGLLSETNGVDQKNKLTRSVTHSSSKPTREISQESSKKVVKKKSTNKRKRLHDRVKSEILLTNQPKKDVSKQFSQCWNQLEALAYLYEKENEIND